MTVALAIGLVLANYRGVPAGTCDRYDHTRLDRTGVDAPAHRVDERYGRSDWSGGDVERHPVREQMKMPGSSPRGKRTAIASINCGDSTAGNLASGVSSRPPFYSTADLTTLFLSYYAVRFNVFDGTLGRTLVGNLAYFGFGQFPGGSSCFGLTSSWQWFYWLPLL